MMVESLVSAAIERGPQDVVRPQATQLDRFGTWLDGQIGDLNAEIESADRALQEFAVGETRSIHHVMLSLEKARLSFQLAVQVRNKVLEAYQEVMRMQV